MKWIAGSGCVFTYGERGDLVEFSYSGFSPVAPTVGDLLEFADFIRASATEGGCDKHPAGRHRPSFECANQGGGA